MRRRLIIVLFVYAAILFDVGFTWVLRQININQNASVAALQAKADVASGSTSQKYYAGTPTSLYIPAINLNLDVINGSYNAALATWTLTPNKAQFAVSTEKPNNKKGLTFIYGHDLPQVFAPTANLKPGDIAEVKTSNGLTFSYQYTNSSVISPSDTAFLKQADTGKPRLSLLTCTGLWYQYRHLMNFKLMGVRRGD